MSRFYGITIGDKAKHQATRCGSGRLHTYNNSWIAGVEVVSTRADYNTPVASGQDIFTIYLTTGSANRARKKLCTLSENDIIEILRGKPSLMDIYLRSNSNE